MRWLELGLWIGFVVVLYIWHFVDCARHPSWLRESGRVSWNGLDVLSEPAQPDSLNDGERSAA